MWYYVARYQKPFEAPLNVLSGVCKPTWPTAPDINFVFITWCSSYIQRTAGGSPSNPAFPQHRSCWLENEDTLLHCWRFLCRLLVFSFSGLFLSAKAWAWLTCCLSAAFCPVFLQPFSHCFLFWPAGHGIKKHIKQTRHQVQKQISTVLGWLLMLWCIFDNEHQMSVSQAVGCVFWSQWDNQSASQGLGKEKGCRRSVLFKLAVVVLERAIW